MEDFVPLVKMLACFDSVRFFICFVYASLCNVWGKGFLNFQPTAFCRADILILSKYSCFHKKLCNIY